MVEHLNDHLSCPICIEICTNAVETACCSHLLCENCCMGLRSCPVCRCEPFKVNVNKVIRRMVGAMPVQCKCGVSTTRADLSAHEKVCPMHSVVCNVANCGYSGPNEAFLKHIIDVHSDKLISHYGSPQQPASAFAPPRDCIGAKGRARIGSTGKYYCGQQFAHVCGCCNGVCGPRSGCNCENCMMLDIESRALPKGHLVNKQGRIARVGEDNTWYCGAKVMEGVFGCDGWCGPTNGPQCPACQQLQGQLAFRYTAIVASWARH